MGVHPSDTLAIALSAELGALLDARGWHITVAESCTGGLVAGAITATAGSSAWFEVGFVTYGNGAKVEVLRVAEATLARHGAVSEQTAVAMAEGALDRSGADLAVAITGIAGPGGGSADKPVGTVCFAWVSRGGQVTSATRHFDGDRAAVRAASVVAALEGAIDLVRRG